MTGFVNKMHVKISIHAPTRGATRTRCSMPPTWEFQSTLPRGERHKCVEYVAAWELISIHAPTRGATATPPKTGGEYLFQSTLPRGERPFAFSSSSDINDFNPRSHAGSDCGDSVQ